MITLVNRERMKVILLHSVRYTRSLNLVKKQTGMMQLKFRMKFVSGRRRTEGGLQDRRHRSRKRDRRRRKVKREEGMEVTKETRE